MTIASDLTRIKNAKTAIRQAIIDKGVDVPETELISTYSGYIDQISTQVGPDPNDPTLANLKLALATDDPASIYPAGTEIPDTYNGNFNPLIVAQYLDSSSDAYKDSAGNNAEGAILVRKFVEPTSQQFGSSMNYATSAIKTFLDTTYLNNCSEALKSVISNVSVQCYNGSSKTTVAGKLFLMSGIETGGTFNAGEGVFWDYWKKKTGLATASDSANTGRIVTDLRGSPQLFWLRSRYSSGAIRLIKKDGAYDYFSPSLSYGVLPACFIAKD